MAIDAPARAVPLLVVWDGNHRRDATDAGAAVDDVDGGRRREVRNGSSAQQQPHCCRVFVNTQHVLYGHHLESLLVKLCEPHCRTAVINEYRLTASSLSAAIAGAATAAASIATLSDGDGDDDEDDDDDENSMEAAAASSARLGRTSCGDAEPTAPKAAGRVVADVLEDIMTLSLLQMIAVRARAARTAYRWPIIDRPVAHDIGFAPNDTSKEAAKGHNDSSVAMSWCRAALNKVVDGFADLTVHNHDDVVLAASSSSHEVGHLPALLRHRVNVFLGTGIGASNVVRSRTGARSQQRPAEEAASSIVAESPRLEEAFTSPGPPVRPPPPPPLPSSMLEAFRGCCQAALNATLRDALTGLAGSTMGAATSGNDGRWSAPSTTHVLPPAPVAETAISAAIASYRHATALLRQSLLALWTAKAEEGIRLPPAAYDLLDGMEASARLRSVLAPSLRSNLPPLVSTAAMATSRRTASPRHVVSASAGSPSLSMPTPLQPDDAQKSHSLGTPNDHDAESGLAYYISCPSRTILEDLIMYDRELRDWLVPVSAHLSVSGDRAVVHATSQGVINTTTTTEDQRAVPNSSTTTRAIVSKQYIFSDVVVSPSTSSRVLAPVPPRESHDDFHQDVGQRLQRLTGALRSVLHTSLDYQRTHAADDAVRSTDDEGTNRVVVAPPAVVYRVEIQQAHLRDVRRRIFVHHGVDVDAWFHFGAALKLQATAAAGNSMDTSVDDDTEDGSGGRAQPSSVELRALFGEAAAAMHPSLIKLTMRALRSPPRSFALHTNAHLRPYQVEALQHFSPPGTQTAHSGVIVLPCGAGKTLTGIAAAALLQPSFVLVVCINALSVVQWRNEFLRWTTLDPADVTICTGKVKQLPAMVFITTYAMLTTDTTAAGASHDDDATTPGASSSAAAFEVVVGSR